jgi:hypothetical protein
MIDAFGGCCIYDESSRETEGDYGSLGWLLAGEEALTLSNLNDSQLTELVLENLPACLQHGRSLVLESQVHSYAGAGRSDGSKVGRSYLGINLRKRP